MPQQQIIQRARKDARQGKSASTQAGEFVKNEIDRIRQGKHGAKSAKQAIAIGLSEARRAGVKLPPAPGTQKKATKSRRPSSETSVKRSKAALKALKKEPTSTVSKSALAKQTRQAAKKRGPAQRSLAAKKAARTRSQEARSSLHH